MSCWYSQATNQASCLFSPGADAQKFEITIGTSKKLFELIIWTIRSTKNIADTFEFSLGLRSVFHVVHRQ